MGINLPSPICTALFLDPVKGLLADGYSERTRLLALGVVMASYSISGLIGGPILGQLCDKIGQRRILIFSLIGFVGGYLLSAIAVENKQFLAFLLGRVIIGFFSGIAFIAQVALVRSPQSNKLKDFCYFSIFYSLGSVIGPLLGGLLSDSSLLTWFDLATPFWFGALTTGLMIPFMLLNFKDGNHVRNYSTSQSGMVRSFFQALLISSKRTIFISYFLFNVGLSLILVFYPIYLIKKFNTNSTDLAMGFAYLALWSAGAQFAMAKLSEYFKFTLGIKIALISLAVSTYFLNFVVKISSLLWILPLLAIFSGLSFTYFSLLLTNLAKKGDEGKFLGVGLSLLFLGQIVSPLIPGALSISNIAIVIMFGSLCFLISAALLLKTNGLFSTLRKQ